uniref:FGENESH: predicted gene_7.482 protein n=1 Tax=Rhodotorula toruloides TaxID=5286 RepID=A0A0K3CM08_RHOTO
MRRTGDTATALRGLMERHQHTALGRVLATRHELHPRRRQQLVSLKLGSCPHLSAQFSATCPDFAAC